LNISKQAVNVSVVNTHSLSATQNATVSTIQKMGTDEVSVNEVFTTYEKIQHDFLKKLGSYDFNDGGNAKRFVADYKDKVKYNSTMQNWLVWNGKYWELDTKNKVVTFAQEVAKQILASASVEKEIDKAKKSCQMGTGIKQ
jgi:hypothetical protein